MLLIRLYPHDLLTLSILPISGLCIWALEHQSIALAISLLFFSMLFDALDGYIARKTGRVRDFGRFLDSFMDLISYLLLPTYIAYSIGFQGIYVGFLLLMISSGCIRLSYFNTIGFTADEEGKPAYPGMPVFWSTFILAGYYMVTSLSSVLFSNMLYAICLTLFSAYMVLNKPFFKFTSIAWLILAPVYGMVLFFSFHALTQFSIVETPEFEASALIHAAANLGIIGKLLMTLLFLTPIVVFIHRVGLPYLSNK